jgi:hypothetical protein
MKVHSAALVVLRDSVFGPGLAFGQPLQLTATINSV